MKAQKQLTRQQEIIQKHVVNPFTTLPNEWHKSMGKMMDEWGLEIIKHLDSIGVFDEFPLDSTATGLYESFKKSIK